MKNIIKKVISIFLLISLVISSMPIGAIMAAYIRPSVSVSSPNRSSVSAGGSVSYTIIYSDADYINLSSSYIALNGFTANVSVSGSGNTRIVTLSNIQGSSGQKSISIKANSAQNDSGYALATPNSIGFTLNNTASVTSSDSVRPSVSVSSPSRLSVSVGGTVSYTISFTDNVGISRINTSSSYITLNGFTANVSVSNSSNKSVVTLTNIQGTAGNKSIGIRAGAAQDAAGNSTAAISSTVAFNLVANNTSQNTTSNTTNNVDKVRPSISVSEPSNRQVYSGGSLSYAVSFADNRGIERINLSSSYITLNGFTANISISGKGLTRLITLSNIQGTAGKKNINIKAGAAQDAAGNITLATPNSISFEIVNKQNTTTTNNNNTKSTSKNTSKNTSKSAAKIKKDTNLVINKNTNEATVRTSTFVKSTPKLVSGCNDSSSVLGDINKEVKTFSTWLTSKKEVTTYAQENNYVAKDEEITYFVDYYNGKEDAAKNVNIKLNIPYNVEVLEINSDGNIAKQNSSETTIEWNMGTVQYGAKCRLYVKVKFLQNTLLEESDKISETFYVNLNTKYDSKNENSYLRQLYIDNSSNKTATMQKYLSAIDNTNSIRPDDKITRAELAKLLVDAGIVEVKQGNTDYKKYKDSDEIPSYARDAVSALYNTGIIEKFEDGEFKPNNPIVRDEFFKIVAKASQYVSDGKLKTKTATFIYTDIIDDKDKTLTDNKDYIMELIRQNVIKKEDTKSDEYTLRKEAVEVINSLTFRGPYVEKIEAKVVKFADVEENSKYFYNLVGASNTYTYNYTETLLQQITSVK